jgi:DNA-binding CsgD family transcriptional regulator
MSRVRRDLAFATRAVEAAGDAFLIVDRDGRIRRGTAGVERWLARYFGPGRRPDHLPARLWEWVKWHEAMRGRVDALAPVRRPFVVEGEGRRLTVRFVSQPPDTVLLLNEVMTRPEPAALTRLGLSSREAEVLALATAGRTNPAIAAVLHISPRTVQTHLERIYRKLGVETRTAAAARALEAMRAEPAERA